MGANNLLDKRLPRGIGPVKLVGGGERRPRTSVPFRDGALTFRDLRAETPPAALEKVGLDVSSFDRTT
jgi:hypothetical protein